MYSIMRSKSENIWIYFLMPVIYMHEHTHIHGKLKYEPNNKSYWWCCSISEKKTRDEIK